MTAENAIRPFCVIVAGIELTDIEQLKLIDPLTNPRPQTLYGIADSPVGLAAWILDHDARGYELIARVFDGQPEGLTRDDVLDNITVVVGKVAAAFAARP